MINEEARIEAHEAAVAHLAPADTLTPADRYQELFVDIQRARIFTDSKTFVDCVPKRDPTSILEAYRHQRHAEGFHLADFVHANFQPEHAHKSDYVSDPHLSLVEHIDSLWPVLTRSPTEHPRHASLLPLPFDYVVPGGRFGEIYYWDSYFTMLGLADSGRGDLLHAMVENFAYIIDIYGHIPNGNRTYYLSRSQPPMFAMMVELYEANGLADATRYLPHLIKEYDWWMSGAESLRPGDCHAHCVKLDDGTVLNRYWDERDTPREESYLEDVSTAARQSARPAAQVYRDLRAAAASGWDFSSRWYDNGLSDVRTTSILPVDLNAMLQRLEATIARLGAKAGDTDVAEHFKQRAEARKQAINRLLWNDAQNAYFDFDWARGTQREGLTAAAFVPLFFKLALPERANRLAQTLRDRLLQPGGVATTEVLSGQQWDRPNGWAPLQWMTIRGLANYRQLPLAFDIAERWLATVGELYQRDSKLVEKYSLTPVDKDTEGGGGGEYPLQDGFGWTNGVTRRLLHEHPKHAARQAKAGSRKRAV